MHPDPGEDVAVALRDYRDLYLVRGQGLIVVRGRFPIADETGIIDRFTVEITIDPAEVDELPIVREVGGRIPWDPERHVNHDGTACVVVPEEWLAIRPDPSFATFLAGPVRNFFIGQGLVERGKPWPAGERSHGKAGRLEAYAELLGVTGESAIKAYLRLLRRGWIGGHNPCPCGSGVMLRRCHLGSVRALQARIAPRLAERMLEQLS